MRANILPGHYCWQGVLRSASQARSRLPARCDARRIRLLRMPPLAAQ